MKLIKPSQEYFEAYYEACKESYVNNVTEWMPFDPKDYDHWKSNILQIYTNYETGQNIPEQMPRIYTYWCIEEEQLVGEIQLRPFLTESQAKEWGHVSYAVRYSKWHQGYGTKLLKMSLDIAREFEINNVYIACRSDNMGSIRIIEKNMGRFVHEFIDEEGMKNNLYLISVEGRENT